MADDPIIDEIHRVRREIAREFGGDVHALFSFLRQRTAQNDNVVTLQPVPPDPSSGGNTRR
jgi:hypothetical protein